MLWILIFTLITIVWTTTNNVGITAIGVLLCIGVGIYKRSYQMCIATGVICVACLFYELKTPPLLSVKTPIITTGIIIQSLGQEKYELEIKSIPYLFKSKNTYFPGDTIQFLASFQEIRSSSGFNYQKRIKMKGYRGVLLDQQSSIQSGSIDSWLLIQKRKILYKIIQSVPHQETQAFTLGMLIGDKSRFSKEIYQTTIDAGTVHIIAVSGGNIALLVSFLSLCFFWIPFYPRLWIIGGGILIYGIICGMDSSVIRAIIMGMCSLIALWRGVSVNIWRMLGISYLVMLMINPYFLLYDVGFLLSFTAIIGIIRSSSPQSFDSNKDIQKKTAATFFTKGKKVLSWIYKNYVQASWGATLGVLPIMLVCMGSMNILGVLGNIFIVPLIPLLMIFGFFLVVFPSSWMRPIFLIQKWLVNRVIIVSETTQKWGWYLIVQDDNISIVCLIVMVSIIIGYVWYGQNKNVQGQKRTNEKKHSPCLFLIQERQGDKETDENSKNKGKNT